MTTKKNPKKGLPFVAGETNFVQIVPCTGLPFKDLSEAKLYRYEGEASGGHKLRLLTGLGHHGFETVVSQESLLTDFKVQPKALVKSKLSINLEPLLFSMVELHKTDGCNAKGKLVGILLRRVECGELDILTPTQLRLDGVGLIPIESVLRIEVING